MYLVFHFLSQEKLILNYNLFFFSFVLNAMSTVKLIHKYNAKFLVVLKPS